MPHLTQDLPNEAQNVRGLYIYIYRQTDRQTDRQAGRQAGRQPDRQTDRQTERERERVFFPVSARGAASQGHQVTLLSPWAELLRGCGLRFSQLTCQTTCQTQNQIEHGNAGIHQKVPAPRSAENATGWIATTDCSLGVAVSPRPCFALHK